MKTSIERSIRTSTSALLLLAGLAVAPAAFASDECKPHSLFTPMQGYQVYDCAYSDFDAKDIPVRMTSDVEAEKKTVEGVYEYVEYAVDEGVNPSSPLKILRNHLAAAKAMGATVLMESGPGWHMVGEWGSIQQQIATVRLERNGREYWVHLGSVNGGDYYAIASMSPEPMAQEVEGNELLEQFASQGFVALDVHFDTGKATLRPESAEGLDRAAAMLQQAPAVRAEVGGHTDNVGKPESNRLLSQQRAESVRAALVQRGVAADRLTAKGYGDTVPVADNRSEAGRAANRRVEVRKTGGELGRATAATTTSTPKAKRAEPEADGGEPGFVQQRASNARDTVESEAGAKVDDTVREKARGLMDRLF